jgi:prevent-host-death family protein
MKTATVSRLKASLSEYLAGVRSGESLIVTDRGRPVAKIIPLTRGDTEVPAHLLELQRCGAVRLGTGALPAGFLEAARPRDAGGRVLESLLKEREESR